MPSHGTSRFCHEVALGLPDLSGELGGLRIAHLSDLHIARPRARYQRIIDDLAGLDCDLVFLTGDYMNHPGDEPAALAVMRRIVTALRPRLGVYGVFGNHDTPLMREMLADLDVHWLIDAGHVVPGLPLHLLGFETDRERWPDLPRLLEHWFGRGQASPGPGTDGARPAMLRLLLCHYPLYLPTAADLGVHLMFSGHTHGGQMRLPGRRALYNSCDLPLHLSAGILRHRSTLCAVSRGLGETFVPVRLFCPPHLPIYVLRKGALPGRDTWQVENVQPW